MKEKERFNKNVMKRTILIIFILVLAGIFVWAWTSRMKISFSSDSRETVRTIIPTVSGNSTENLTDANKIVSYDESLIQPLVPLENDETFLQAISVDLNKDGTADQICAVKKTSDITISLVPGIHNPLTNDYIRLESLSTGVTQARTLLFYTLDIIGDRRQAIVCSGMNAENLQVLAVYIPSYESNGKITYTTIADLRSDGSINIQENNRSDAYNLGLTSGDSFPIYTYNSDPESPQTLNQIERLYQWNRNIGRYEQISESRIEGKKIEIKLVRQLQNGDVGSFETFLNGLWYNPSSNTVRETRSIFFNTAEDEIVFHSGNTEEVYTRESGAPRRYGAYFTTRNKSISSIRRLIDIELTGIDEIKIKVQEDVKLKIGVASNWDGTYRKMSVGQMLTESSRDQKILDFQKILKEALIGWESSDGQTFSTKGNMYSLERSSNSESGQFAILTVQNKLVIQCKKNSSKDSVFFLAETATINSGKDKVSQLTLTEVTITTEGIARTGVQPLVLVQKK